MRQARQPTETEREVLGRMAQQEMERVALRAQMVFLSVRGFNVSDIADIQNTSRATVYKWLDRFDNEGPAGLYDRPRNGRRANLDEEGHETIDERPTEHGYNLTVTTALQLTQDLEQTLKQTFSEETMRITLHHVKQIWRQVKNQAAASVTRTRDGVQEAAEQFIDQQLPSDLLGITGLNLRNYDASPAPVSPIVATSYQWGWLPQIALLQSLSLLLIATAYSGARNGQGWAASLFWLGLAALIIPVVIRIISPEASRRERIALVVLLGMACYLVKVMHSPVAFTFPDELSHVRNVQETLENGRLFQGNPSLPATARYPGLQMLTSTLASLSGASIFTSGIIVIGMARLILFLALYLFFEQIQGSTRVAALTVVLYMANPNFLYWTAEYAYESLALPLSVFVLYLVARREMTGMTGRKRSVLTVLALFGVLVVVVTHHMTSYVLTAILFGLTFLSVVRSRGTRRGPWDIALFALLASATWLIFVASLTIDYLLPVLEGAVRSGIDLIVGGETGRELFDSSTGYVAPAWERLTTFSSLLLIALGLPFGLLEFWSRLRSNVFALLLVSIALFYLPMQLMRFTSGGWETANRSSEFLFIGLSFVLALGIVRLWKSWRFSWASRGVLALVVVILFFGGFIIGWPPKGRLPRPYVVDAGNHLVEPQGVSVAKWASDVLGPDRRIAVDRSNAKLLTAYGEQIPFTGSKHGMKAMLLSDQVGPSERSIIQNHGIQYVVIDRRLISWDHMIGLYFFNEENSPTWEQGFLERDISTKFDEQNRISRILDSGNIAIYDVRTYHYPPPQ